MTAVSRRAVLVGCGAAVIGGAIGIRERSQTLSLPFDLVPAGKDALVLHDGDATAQRFVRNVRSIAQAAVVSQVIAPIARKGFAALAPIIHRAKGAMLLAVLNDAEVTIVETLLLRAGASGIARRRHGRHVLLTAHL